MFQDNEGQLLDNWADYVGSEDHLEQIIKTHDRDIEKLCNAHYQGFIDSIRELLLVRSEAQDLKVGQTWINFKESWVYILVFHRLLFRPLTKTYNWNCKMCFNEGRTLPKPGELKPTWWPPWISSKSVFPSSRCTRSYRINCRKRGSYLSRSDSDCDDCFSLFEGITLLLNHWSS